MVDAQYAQLTDKVVAAIRQISPAPIRFMANTHLHVDHTGGNANFAKMASRSLRVKSSAKNWHVTGVGQWQSGSGEGSGLTPRRDLWAGRPVKFHMNGEIVD